MIWLAGPQCSLKHEWITTETLPTDFFQNALDTSNCYQHLISCGSGKVHMRCGWRIWFTIEHSELVSLWNHVKENNTMRGKWCLKVWRNGGRHCPFRRQNKKTSCPCAKLCLLERVKTKVRKALVHWLHGWSQVPLQLKMAASYLQSASVCTSGNMKIFANQGVKRMSLNPSHTLDDCALPSISPRLSQSTSLHVVVLADS